MHLVVVHLKIIFYFVVWPCNYQLFFAINETRLIAETYLILEPQDHRDFQRALIK